MVLPVRTVSVSSSAGSRYANYKFILNRPNSRGAHETRGAAPAAEAVQEVNWAKRAEESAQRGD